MSSALIASLSLVAMLLLIWCGMHVAVVLALVSFVGVWLIKGDVEVAANLLAQARRTPWPATSSVSCRCSC